jgi:signal transduction histidine kinase
VAVAVIGVAATLVAFAFSMSERNRAATNEFASGAEEAQTLITDRVSEHADLLWDLRAYFGTIEFVTRDDFSTFVSGESVPERFPGTRALGFSPVVQSGDVAAFERDIRSDTSVDPGGYPDFEVNGGDSGSTLLPITYIEPLDGNESAFGYDVAADGAGSEAVDAAVATGLPAAGAPLLADEPDGPLLVMLLALYDGDGVPSDESVRVSRFEGVVLGLYSVDEMMAGVLGDEPLADVEIYDAGLASAAGSLPPSEESLLYDSSGDLDALDSDAAPRPNREVLTTVGGRRWRLFFTPGPSFDRGGIGVPLAVVAVGLVLTALIGALLFERARSRERAEALTEDMTGDLNLRERQLKRATADIVRSNRDLERYATIAAHDLQEPLRSILAYSDLLHRKYEEDLDKEVVDYIDRMGQAAERMRTLVTDLLAYARLETADHRTRSVDLNRVMEAAISDLTFLIDETGATIQVASLPTVMGNERELIGVFANLMSNALKYRDPSRAPVVRVSAKRVGEEYLMRVADNGIGIAPDYHLRIFELFRRLGPRDDGAGTGLGLAICARTVVQHGGRIWVESEEGQGATFLFTLPARQSVKTRPTAEDWR